MPQLHSRKTKDGSGRHRYARRSTKSRIAIRPPRHPGRLVAILLGIPAVVMIALIWGSLLADRADAYREQESHRSWMLDEDVAANPTLTVPDVRALAIYPEQNTAPLLGTYEAVLLPLRAPDGGFYFASSVATEAGLTPARPPLSDTVPAGGLSLADEVARIARRGLRVIAVFEVTYPTIADVPTRTYRRGLELAMLAEYAKAGMDDMLILGLPCGTDHDDRESAAFLTDLRALTTAVATSPAIGTVLPLSAFTADFGTVSDDLDRVQESPPLYTGRLTPGRMSLVADFLVMDLRGESAQSLEELLPHLQYAYVGHGLRLLVADTECAKVPVRHGFTRVFEMPLVTSPDGNAA